jgi:hypothetical protein
MEKSHDPKLDLEKRHESLVRFLQRTHKGEYVEVEPAYTSGRLPDYTITDYEEEAYIFSYT